MDLQSKQLSRLKGSAFEGSVDNSKGIFLLQSLRVFVLYVGLMIHAFGLIE